MQNVADIRRASGAVRGKFDEIFARADRRLFISCFSSSIHRIKLAFEMARDYKRKIAL